MAVLRRKCGEMVYITDSLHVVVLAIHGSSVQFAVYDTRPEKAGTVLSRQMSDLCRNKLCYFWFPTGGCCTLVVQCDKGKSVWLIGANRLTVTDVCGDIITVAITGRPATDQLTLRGRSMPKQRSTMPVRTNPRRCVEANAGQFRGKVGK